MSNFARKKISHHSIVGDDEATPTGPNGHFIISNGSMPTSPVLLSSPDILHDEPDSPELYRTNSYDKVLFDIRKINPEKIAAQMTLLDLPLFKAIQMEEFRECRWTKKEKQRLAPNIVAFTNKFNHTSFWVVQEILNEPMLRVRSEIIMQFIRIAKKLFDMNNIHSLAAVVSALQSTSIFRLTQTWKCVHKKEKSVYDKLQEFLSDTDNWKQLREHMNAARLPCIPHLAIYLTDLTYLNTVATKNALRQIETVLNMIAYCQNSCYDGLVPEVPIQKYLKHKRYIEELLKFFEEEQYKLSLKREPDVVRLRHSENSSTARPPATLRTSKSHEDLLTPFSSGTRDPFNHTSLEPPNPSSKMWTPQPQHRTLSMRHTVGESTGEEIEQRAVRLSAILNDEMLAGDIQVKVDSSPEVDVKQWSYTLPSGAFLSEDLTPRDPFQPPASSSSSSSAASSRTNVRGAETAGTPVAEVLKQPPPSAPPVVGRKPNDSPSQWTRRHRKSFSVGTNVLAVLGIGKSGKHSTTNSSSTTGSPELTHQHTTVSLIDDSVLDTTFATGTSYSGTPTGSLGNLSSSSSGGSEEGGEEGEEEEGTEDVTITLVDIGNSIKEGTLKRKVLRRRSKPVPSLARRKTKYWVQLTDSSLILHSSKPSARKPSKEKVKRIPLSDCRVKYRDPTEKMSDKAFVVVDGLGTHSKFSAKTPGHAQVWVDKIRHAINQEQERRKQEIEKSLIKL